VAQLACPKVSTGAEEAARAHSTAPAPREQPAITRNTCTDALQCATDGGMVSCTTLEALIKPRLCHMAYGNPDAQPYESHEGPQRRPSPT
jgi:hypothetical protein